MTEKNIWGQEEILESLKTNQLQKYPPVKSYLYSGAKVLDVGCGPGSFTLDVAAEVHPGSVVGVDLEQKAIDKAIELADKSQVNNVTFQVGDAYSLEFRENTFDVAYSLNLLVWLRNPQRALQEQRRVTKQGGWVLAQLADYGSNIFYPPCPSFEKILALLPQLRDPSDMEVFMDTHQGRRAVELLSQSGFKEMKIEGWVQVNYPGSDRFERLYGGWSGWLAFSHPFSSLLKKLLDLGALDEKTLCAAQGEIDAWHAHPHAFHSATPLLAAGRVT